MSTDPSDFQNKISGGNFFDAFASIVEDAVTLEIATIVETQEDPDNFSDQNQKKTKGIPGRRMITTIALLDGDITNYVGDQYLENEAYKELRDFHQTQVDKGQQIIKDNLETLKTLVDHLIAVYQQDPSKQNK